MGTFSEINLEQDYPESTGTSAFSSPFISNMTGGLQSPFISSGTHTAAPSPQQPSIQPEQAVTPAKEAAESKSADCQTVPESAEKNKAPQSGQNFAEQSADVTADEKTEEEKKKAHEAAEAKRKMADHPTMPWNRNVYRNSGTADQGFAIVRGVDPIAMGKRGDYLAFAKELPDGSRVSDILVVRVDGEKIAEDTYYNFMGRKVIEPSCPRESSEVI